MTARLYTVAMAPFEAARQVAILPAGHRCRRLHGHSFLARARAQLPPGWAPFHGAETDALAERLAASPTLSAWTALAGVNSALLQCA